MTHGSNGAQASLDWSAEPALSLPRHPEPIWAPTGAKLDAEGHAWWAKLCGNAHENLISLSADCAKHGQEREEKDCWDLIKIWKGMAAYHEAQSRL